MQMAIQPVSHNTILVSSRPVRHVGLHPAKNPSSQPKLLATFLGRFAPGAESTRPANALKLCDFGMVLARRTG
ncbi:hypothetical protein [Bradyrhizobium sp. UFLA05-112]